MKNSASAPVIERQILIMEYLQQHKECTLQAIYQYLVEKDIIVSEDTVEDDLKVNLASIVEIEKIKNRNYYTIINDANTLTLIRQWSNASFLMSKALLYKDVLALEENKSFGNLHLLPQLLDSCKYKKALSVKYKRRYDNMVKTYQLSPIGIKEYETRFYLVALVHEHKEVRVFSVDQIQAFLLTPAIKFVAYKDSLATIFQHTIGVSNHFNDEPKYTKAKILDENIIPYFQNKPFHVSQKINKEEKTIEWYVVHNIEFKRKLLAFYPELQIVEPITLSQNIKQCINRINTVYDK